MRNDRSHYLAPGYDKKSPSIIDLIMYKNSLNNTTNFDFRRKTWI